MNAFTESMVEEAALAWLEALGWEIQHGPAIAAGEPDAERSDPNYRDVLLERRLRQSLVRLNPNLPPEALEDAFRKIVRLEGAALETRNRHFHCMLVEGATVEYRTTDGSIRGAQAQVLDFENPENNDWLRFSISKIPKTTTGWRSISSPFLKTTTYAVRMWFYSSTAFPWSSSNLKILPMKTQPWGPHFSSFKITKPNFQRFSASTNFWLSPTVWKRVWERLQPAGNGLNHGAPSPERPWQILISPNSRSSLKESLINSVS